MSVSPNHPSLTTPLVVLAVAVFGCRYRDFLSKVCAAADAEPDEGGGGGGDAATDLVKDDWSDLWCRVEEGFRRVSTVLEDGTIQVNRRLWVVVSVLRDRE